MGKKRRVAEEDLIIPKQDGRICGTICICQMTLVLSCVAVVYLTVAVYAPAHKAFTSEIVETPVMCTTTRAEVNATCVWGSCGEWCLSKGTGPCMQINVNLRRNGSSLTFENCTNSVKRICHGFEMEKAKNYTCVYDSCKNMSGIFNCSKGVCYNITDAYICEFHHSDPPLKCSARRGFVTCMKIQGLFNCTKGDCERIRVPYNCDRRCIEIPTHNKNVILLSGDEVYMSRCDAANNSLTKQTVWSDSSSDILMASCWKVNMQVGFEALDCIYGSVLPSNTFGELSNFTYLSSYFNMKTSTPSSEIALAEADLTIKNDSRLMINLEGCVNTLRDECNKFFRIYAKDGKDNNARARFACFYSELDTNTSVVRFDLKTEYAQFMFAFILPVVLLVVSCATLIVCQRLVVVGDDAKMRFKHVTTEETRRLSKDNPEETDAI